MRSIWIGSAPSQSSSAVNYHFPTATEMASWSTDETRRCAPLSEDIVITRFKVWIETAPGASKSFAFTIRDTSVDTAASVTISNTSTEAEWAGRLSMAQISRISVKSAPTATPAASVRVYWSIEYMTAGNFYLVPGGTGGSQNSDAELMMMPFGGNNYTPTGSGATARAAVIPTDITVTRIAAYTGGSTGNNYLVVKNGSTYSSFTASNSSGNPTGVSPEGSLAFSAGDTMNIRQWDSGSAWDGHSFCITVVPSKPGEVIYAYASGDGMSTTGTEYEGLNGLGNNLWSATEADAHMRFPAGIVKKLYVMLGTAPGTGDSYTFTIRSNATNTNLTCTVSEANTTATDSSNSFWNAEGNFLSVQSVPSGTPSAAAYSKVSIVMEIPQPNDFFSMF